LQCSPARSSKKFQAFKKAGHSTSSALGRPHQSRSRSKSYSAFSSGTSGKTNSAAATPKLASEPVTSSWPLGRTIPASSIVVRNAFICLENYIPGAVPTTAREPWLEQRPRSAGSPAHRRTPAPPPSIDEGPSIPAPDDNSTYVTGCWVHRETRYFWRPSFWLEYRPDWLWSPSHYLWTAPRAAASDRWEGSRSPWAA
jgi:hypothetical protein